MATQDLKVLYNICSKQDFSQLCYLCSYIVKLLIYVLEIKNDWHPVPVVNLGEHMDFLCLYNNINYFEFLNKDYHHYVFVSIQIEC